MAEPVLVVHEHRVVYADPIRLRAGEPVARGRRDDEFPEWIWCRAGDGRQGWVHESLLVGEGDQARAASDYDAGELAVAAGEPVVVERRLGGWLWARSADGREGWIPEACLGGAGSPM